MSSYSQTVRDLLDEAGRLPDGFARVSLVEEAVALADSHGDIELGYEARQRLMEDAMDGGLPDRLLVAFAWCCGQSDRDPARFPEGDILWSYRWVINEAASFPSIPLSKLDELQADMRARYSRAGSTLRPYHLLRKNLFNTLGDPGLARAAHEQWRASARDHLSDSHETELAFHVSYLLLIGEFAAAAKAAKPILEGRFGSDHFEATERGEMLLPLLQLGRVAEAAECHRRGYPMVANNPRFAFHSADHAAFLAISENVAAAGRLLAKHFSVAHASVDPLNRFNSWSSLEIVLERMVRRNVAMVPLPGLPAAFPVAGKDRRYPAAEVLRWCEREAEALADEFDRRNATSHYSEELAKTRALRDLSLPFSVGPSKGADANERYLNKPGKYRID